MLRKNNIVKNDNLKVSNYTYFPDPLDTALKECGLASRGLSKADAEKIYKSNNEKKL